MFSYLVEIVFPSLGNFFGILSAIASEAGSWLGVYAEVGEYSFFYVNLFTGVRDYFVLSSSSFVGAIAYLPISAFYNIFVYPFAELPFFLALLMGFLWAGVVVSIVKWIIDIII